MRRLLVPAAVVLMLLSGSAVAAAAKGPLAAAAAKTLRQGSEQVSLTATIDLGPTFGKADLKAAGPYDQGAKRGTLKGTLALAGSGKTPVTEVFDGATLYVDSPLFAALLPPGKTWLAINLQKPGTVAGFDLGSLAGQSPASVLAALGGAAKVQVVGKEQADGAQTTHYRAALSSPAYKPVDVWVDGSGLVRKAHLDYTTKGATAQTGTHVVLDMHLSDFGVKVNVSVPPKAKVADASSTKGLTG